MRYALEKCILPIANTECQSRTYVMDLKFSGLSSDDFLLKQTNLNKVFLSLHSLALIKGIQNNNISQLNQLPEELKNEIMLLRQALRASDAYYI